MNENLLDVLLKSEELKSSVYKYSRFCLYSGGAEDIVDNLAHELTEETISEAAYSWKTFKGAVDDKRVRRWCRAIARNLYIDKIKDEQKKKKLKENLSKLAPYESNFELEKIEKIKQIISSLSPVEQQIIQLFYFERKTLKEIAEILEISYTNIRRLACESRDKILKKFEGQNE